MHLRSPPQHFNNLRRIGEVVSVLAMYRLAEWLSLTEFKSQKKLFTSKEGELLSEQSRATRIRLAVTELDNT